MSSQRIQDEYGDVTRNEIEGQFIQFMVGPMTIEWCNGVWIWRMDELMNLRVERSTLDRLLDTIDNLLGKQIEVTQKKLDEIKEFYEENYGHKG